MKTVKYISPRILLWETIKRDGANILWKCPPIMNSKIYQNQYQNEVPYHRSKYTLDYLDSRYICAVSDWPVQSLELNILKNLWSVLKSIVNKRLPKT